MRQYTYLIYTVSDPVTYATAVTFLIVSSSSGSGLCFWDISSSKDIVTDSGTAVPAFCSTRDA